MEDLGKGLVLALRLLSKDWSPGESILYRRYVCPLKDIDQPETRGLLEAAGKAAYEKGVRWLDLWPGRLIRGDVQIDSRSSLIWLGHGDDLFPVIEQEAEEEL